jgi:hypothetical protein
MKTIHYKTKGFRLDDKVIQTLEVLKRERGLSYNLLFKDLLLRYQKQREDELNQQAPL